MIPFALIGLNEDEEQLQLIVKRIQRAHEKFQEKNGVLPSLDQPSLTKYTEIETPTGTKKYVPIRSYRLALDAPYKLIYVGDRKKLGELRQIVLAGDEEGARILGRLIAKKCFDEGWLDVDRVSLAKLKAFLFQRVKISPKQFVKHAWNSSGCRLFRDFVQKEINCLVDESIQQQTAHTETTGQGSGNASDKIDFLMTNQRRLAKGTRKNFKLLEGTVASNKKDIARLDKVLTDLLEWKGQHNQP